MKNASYFTLKALFILKGLTIAIQKLTNISKNKDNQAMKYRRS